MQTEGLNDAYLKYILCIYELSRQEMDVSCVRIAKRLHVSKPSVSNMLERMMKQGLLVKEKYGKTYLTDKGYLAARKLKENTDFLKEQIAVLKLSLSEEEICKAAYLLAAAFPEKDFAEECGIGSRIPPVEKSGRIEKTYIKEDGT